MVSAAEDEDRLGQHRAFVAAAAEAGVRHVVYTSFAAAAPDAVFTLGRDHWATEQAIEEAGLAHTFLRDSFYLDFLPEIGRRGRGDPRARRARAGWPRWPAPTSPGPPRRCCGTRPRTAGPPTS